MTLFSCWISKRLGIRCFFLEFQIFADNIDNDDDVWQSLIYSQQQQQQRALESKKDQKYNSLLLMAIE